MSARKLSDKEDAIYLGERLRQVRTSKGLSQQELGDALGCSRAQYGKYERGDNFLTIHAVQRVAAALGVKLQTLLEE